VLIVAPKIIAKKGLLAIRRVTPLPDLPTLATFEYGNRIVHSPICQ
jgi:hypothetical protein